MKDEEVLLFIEVAINNGADPTEAIQDMRMIDTMLEMTRTHLLAVGYVKRTSRGFLRKGHALLDAYDNILSARAEGREF